MVRLTSQSYEAARDWLGRHGRPLEQAMLAHTFDGAGHDAVYDALGAYQNADGGFGRRLEADHTDDRSTVLNTTLALEIHRRLGTPDDHPQIVKAVGYLLDQYNADRRVWPIRWPGEPGEPGEPGADGPLWFKAESPEALAAAFGGYKLNPTAEVIGYLHDYAAHVPAGFLREITQSAVANTLAGDSDLEHHGLMCAARLLQSPSLPEAERGVLQDRLSSAFVDAVETDTNKWSGYVLRPTQIVDTPDHPLAGCLPAGLLDADLEYETQRQADDGAWHPFWNWGSDSPAWREAEQAWCSFLTERTLRLLAAFGRIEGRGGAS